MGAHQSASPIENPHVRELNQSKFRVHYNGHHRDIPFGVTLQVSRQLRILCNQFGLNLMDLELYTMDGTELVLREETTFGELNVNEIQLVKKETGTRKKLMFRSDVSWTSLKDVCDGCLSSVQCKDEACDGCPKGKIKICKGCADTNPIKQIFCGKCKVEIFQRLDQDHSGGLQKEELVSFLQCLHNNGYNIDQNFLFLGNFSGTVQNKILDIVDKIFEKYDMDKNGSIDFSEFLRWINDVPNIEKLFFTAPLENPKEGDLKHITRSAAKKVEWKIKSSARKDTVQAVPGITIGARSGDTETGTGSTLGPPKYVVNKTGKVSVTILDKNNLQKKKSSMSFSKQIMSIEELRKQQQKDIKFVTKEKIISSKTATSRLQNMSIQEKESECRKMFDRFAHNHDSTNVQLLIKALHEWGLDLDSGAEAILTSNHTQNEITFTDFTKLTYYLLFIKQVFDDYDTDCNGSLDREELKKCVKYVVEKSSTMGSDKTVMDGLLSIFDGSVQLKENAMPLSAFTTLMLYLTILDKRIHSGSSWITMSELQMFMRLMGMPITHAEAACLFKKFGTTECKNIQFNQILSIITSSMNQWGDIKEAVKLERLKTKNLRSSLNRRHSKITELTRGNTVKFRSIDNKEDKTIETILKAVKASGKKFEDPEFPAEWSVLFPSDPAKRKLISSWKRPCEIHPQAQVFVDGINEGDVVQGSLGDCWFLSALIIISACGNETLKDMFVYSNLEWGFHQVRFFKDKQWHVVTIDDRIPCNGPTPAFAHCHDPTEFWVPLIEKAYAKLHGSYAAIENGNIGDALVDLSGSVSETMDVEETQAFWELMWNNYNKDGYLMGCTNSDPSAPPEKEIPLGILLNHAYGILDCQNVKTDIGATHRLIKLRNPWGKYEWKGRWSDGSWEWTPALKAQLHQIDGDDGVFWMCFEDFCKNYNRLFVLKLFDSSWHKYSFRGMWQGESAGGCTNHTTFPKNPQFAFTASSDSTVFISLCQHDVRRYNKQPPPIGICVVDHNGHEYRSEANPASVLFMSQFVGSRESTLRIDIKGNRTYVLIPCTYLPNIEMPFYITIFSRGTLRVTELKQDLPAVTIKGVWEGKSAGGCFNYGTWIDNSQYLLTVTQKGLVPLMLEQHCDTPHHIGMYMWKSDGGKGVLKQDGVIWQTQLINNTKVGGEILLEPGKYVIIPCTFYPDLKSSFTLKTTNMNCTLQSLPAWNNYEHDGEWKPGACGGCQNNPTWIDNPKYWLKVPSKTCASITITSRNKNLLPMGCYVTNLQLTTTFSGTSRFTNTNHTHHVIELEPGEYMLFVCTFHPETHAPFHVHVHTDLQCGFVPIL